MLIGVIDISGMRDMARGARLLFSLQPKGGNNGNRNKYTSRFGSNATTGSIREPCSGSGGWTEYANGLWGRIRWQQFFLSLCGRDDSSRRQGNGGGDPCDISHARGRIQSGAAAWLKTS